MKRGFFKSEYFSDFYDRENKLLFTLNVFNDYFTFGDARHTN